MRIEHKYDDIIKLEHHVSKIHPRMSLEARSAQFAPFSAVTGYEDEVSEVARVTENQIEVTDEIRNDINKKLRYIKHNPSQQVSITFFVKDTKKQGGKYETTTGLVKKIDDIKNRIDIDLNRFNEVSEADAKESLVITIFIPVKYIGKIELSVNAGTLNITDIENEHIEVNGKISEVTLQGNKSEIEIDSNLDMQISVLSHEGALEINQLSATSRLTLPADYRFRSTKKGIATHIYYERQGKKVDDFSDAEADNYIEFNGIKSELVIVEAEV